MSNNQRPKRSLLGGGGMKTKLALVAGVVILLIIIMMVISSYLGKAGEVQKTRLVEVAQAQSEIIRVSTLGKADTKSIPAQNFAANTLLSTESTQIEIKKFLDKRGVSSKSLNKNLGKAKNSKTDAALKEAAQNNRYDETFTLLMQKQLSDYQKLLIAARDSGSPNEKAFINETLASTAKLLPAVATTAP